MAAVASGYSNCETAVGARSKPPNYSMLNICSAAAAGAMLPTDVENGEIAEIAFTRGAKYLISGKVQPSLLEF